MAGQRIRKQYYFEHFETGIGRPWGISRIIQLRNFYSRKTNLHLTIRLENLASRSSRNKVDVDMIPPDKEEFDENYIREIKSLKPC